VKVLMVHNVYRQPGGEDRVFDAEVALLRSYGHDVVTWVENNDQIQRPSPRLAATAVWSRRSSHRIRAVIRKERPEVVQLHNTFPLVSPAVYYAARAEGVPTVQTLHNYRLGCPAGVLFRDGHPCEDCLGRSFAWPGIIHGCYRDSRAATAAVASMVAIHRAIRTWSSVVDRYIAPTEFARDKVLAAGLPPSRVRVKPNFLAPDPGVRTGEGEYALFVGRLSAEKGVETLLAAWRADSSLPRLVMIGDGPLAPRLTPGGGDRRVRWLTRCSRSAVLDRMGEALVLVVPSTCYEACPLVVIEAFAVGLPVVASDHGALVEMVEEGRTGWRFTPGDPQALAAAVHRAVADPAARNGMRRAARAEYEAKYTAEINYERLMAIYAEVRGAPRDSATAVMGR
jgi:glycosyltransferase involved in cell wall biosynthesis